MMMLSDKKFNQYMENVNKAYVLLAKHVDVLEFYIKKVDPSFKFEDVEKEYDKVQEEVINNFDEKENDS